MSVQKRVPPSKSPKKTVKKNLNTKSKPKKQVKKPIKGKSVKKTTPALKTQPEVYTVDRKTFLQLKRLAKKNKGFSNQMPMAQMLQVAVENYLWLLREGVIEPDGTINSYSGYTKRFLLEVIAQKYLDIKDEAAIKRILKERDWEGEWERRAS